MKENTELEIDVFLPAEIYCAVDTTLEIYNEQVCLQANKYHMNWVCEIGRVMQRKFSVTGKKELIGEYLLTLNVLNDSLEVLWTGSTKLKIISNLLKRGYTCIPIGDSLTNGKLWLGEVQNLSDNKISYIGKIPYSIKLNGITYTGGHEGRSGYAAESYLCGSAYTGSPYGGIDEKVHAFWNSANNRFDWKYYKQAMGVEPDFIQIYLGTNGMALNPNDNAGNIKQIIDYIRLDDTRIPIFVVHTLYRGNQNGMGRTENKDGYTSFMGQLKYLEDKKVLNLMRKLYELLSGYKNLYFIPVAITHDSEYNFGIIETRVNPRAEQTELVPLESVHPQPQGYLQMADCIYSTYCGVLV